MSSTSQHQPDSPLPEELVAYLDGELPPEDCRAIEDRLANDEEYRQQLRDLDQAWEALNVLPAATVDDGFAKTTIELACVAAQDDLSQRKSLASSEDRSRLRWWLAGGVAAALVAFIMVRAFMAHRTNVQLADLPVIDQANTLTHVPNIEFLRKLAATVKPEDFVHDTAAYKENLDNFTKASAPLLADRRQWIESLNTEKKANLAAAARAFDELRSNPEEKKRIRDLAAEIAQATDSSQLKSTLVAYGQWLARHTSGEQEKLRSDLFKASSGERIRMIQSLVDSENEQVAQHLDDADAAILKAAIAKLVKEKQAELLQKFPNGELHDRIAGWDVSKPGPQLLIVKMALANNEHSTATSNELVSQLSTAAQKRWQKVAKDRRERFEQMYVWFHDALRPQWGPAEFEKFFSDENNPSLSNDQRVLDCSICHAPRCAASWRNCTWAPKRASTIACRSGGNSTSADYADPAIPGGRVTADPTSAPAVRRAAKASVLPARKTVHRSIATVDRFRRNVSVAGATTAAKAADPMVPAVALTTDHRRGPRNSRHRHRRAIQRKTKQRSDKGAVGVAGVELKASPQCATVHTDSLATHGHPRCARVI
ncbi:MAG: hypothetical protein U0805_15425 [Pirellulales bacterium]